MSYGVFYVDQQGRSHIATTVHLLEVVIIFAPSQLCKYLWTFVTWQFICNSVCKEICDMASITAGKYLRHRRIRRTVVHVWKQFSGVWVLIWVFFYWWCFRQKLIEVFNIFLIWTFTKKPLKPRLPAGTFWAQWKHTHNFLLVGLHCLIFTNTW